MGFSIDSGISGLGVLFACLLAIPAIIFVIWWVQLNRQVRHEVHDEVEDEGGNPPVA